MASDVTVSIIVCTHNRGEALRRTLTHLGELRIRPEWKTELLVVDNASTDGTGLAVKSSCPGNMEVRYIREERPGKCHALNTALSSCRGDILLFTDDDVFPAGDWVEQMVTPLEEGTYDAVTGQVILEPNLLRDWQTPMHLWWLGQYLEQEYDWGLIGSNMGFRRSVLERVPAFDPALGPGPSALGFCEDTFFGMQLKEAGFRIGYLPQSIAVHQTDGARLRRSAWLSDARGRGRSLAYIRHHWEHSNITWPGARKAWIAMKLLIRRGVQPPPAMGQEGCPAWEMSYVMHMELCSQFRHERRRPRTYARRGLKRVIPSS